MTRLFFAFFFFLVAVPLSWLHNNWYVFAACTVGTVCLIWGMYPSTVGDPPLPH
jgi:hypothetical protein